MRANSTSFRWLPFPLWQFGRVEQTLCNFSREIEVVQLLYVKWKLVSRNYVTILMFWSYFLFFSWLVYLKNLCFTSLESIYHIRSIKYVKLFSLNFRHNEDGSYSYGYEAADGSFKLETRYPDGRVKGKYGYVDIHTGELKVSSVFIKGQESINEVANTTCFQLILGWKILWQLFQYLRFLW